MTRNFETSRIWVTGNDVIVSVMWNSKEAMESLTADLLAIADNYYGCVMKDLCSFFVVMSFAHHSVFQYTWELIGKCLEYDENFVIRFD